MTIFAIIRPDSVAGTTRQFIVTKGNTSNFEWELHANNTAGSRFSVQLYGSAGANRSLYRADVLTSSGWNVIAGSYPGMGKDSDLDLYRNSATELSSTGPGVTSSEAYANGTASVQIGYRADSPASQYFVGAICHVAIFAGEPNISSLFTAADNAGWY